MGKPMSVLILDPFHTGSHAHWSNGLAEALCRTEMWHTVLQTMPGRHWKWRMYAGGAAMAEILQKRSTSKPDVIVTTDMLDVAALKGLLPSEWRAVPVVQYFHENQVTFPWTPDDDDVQSGRDRSYGYLNVQSALAADGLWFNSEHHQHEFIQALAPFMAAFPDYRLKELTSCIASKSQALAIGFNWEEYPPTDIDRAISKKPIILWNHRWEFDKGPDRFLLMLDALVDQNFDFELILCGQQFQASPDALVQIRQRHGTRIIHDGFVSGRTAYIDLIAKSDFLIHAPRQEYFGISVIEAMHCGVIPCLMPGHAYDGWAPKGFMRQTEMSLSEQLQGFSSHGSLWRRRAHEISLQFDWKTVLPEYERALQDQTLSEQNQ